MRMLDLDVTMRQIWNCGLWHLHWTFKNGLRWQRSVQDTRFQQLSLLSRGTTWIWIRNWNTRVQNPHWSDSFWCAASLTKWLIPTKINTLAGFVMLGENGVTQLAHLPNVN